MMGRGAGKTKSINEWCMKQARQYPGSRGALVAATAADIRDVLVEGDSGILNCGFPDERPNYEPSKRRLTWPNGTTAILLSADEPARFRGPQYHWFIADELAVWRRVESWDMLLMGLRLGDDPRGAVATTPRPTALIKSLVRNPMVVVTKGTTYDNRANLASAFFDEIITKYEGTRLGRQELNAEILEDNPGALWTRGLIDDCRVDEYPALHTVAVAVDPSTTSGGDACGIVAGGIDRQKPNHGYVLDDMTVQGSPATWAKATLLCYAKHQADKIIYESNQGGEMVETIIRDVAKSHPEIAGVNIKIESVRATRGKQVRAQPISALYEQKRIHHVGIFARLEDELCEWTPESASSPNRLDALVWLFTSLMSGAQRAKVIGAGWNTMH